MRAFLGLALSPAARQSLHGLQQTLSAAGADVTWVEPHRLHVTVKFLDEITEQQRHSIESMVGDIARREQPMTLQLERVGAFPSLESPRVLWVGVGQGQEMVRRLAAAIEQGSRQMGMPQEERGFSAHVTIGRIRTPRGRAALTQRLREIQWASPPAWLVTSVTLYESVLAPAGPTYTVLAELPLGTAG